jgi:hypothetical protein
VAARLDASTTARLADEVSARRRIDAVRSLLTLLSCSLYLHASSFGRRREDDGADKHLSALAVLVTRCCSPDTQPAVSMRALPRLIMCHDVSFSLAPCHRSPDSFTAPSCQSLLMRLHKLDVSMLPHD